jgi:hypothetical protein
MYFTFYMVQSMFGSGSTAGESWGVVEPVEWFFPEVDAAYLSPAHLFLFPAPRGKEQPNWPSKSAPSGIDPISEGVHAFSRGPAF